MNYKNLVPRDQTPTGKIITLVRSCPRMNGYGNRKKTMVDRWWSCQQRFLTRPPTVHHGLFSVLRNLIYLWIMDISFSVILVLFRRVTVAMKKTKNLKSDDDSLMIRWWNVRLWNLQSAYSFFYDFWHHCETRQWSSSNMRTQLYITNTYLYGHSRRLLDLKFSRELLKMLETQRIQKVSLTRELLHMNIACKIPYVPKKK